ncbi:alpha-1,6-glucosidase domain-containing protein [Aliikangiella coralliicola]|uniref:pullulanase n=1 Tax=Aliikangiella coralliicola TaxID=2592383 RepID=A0A545UJN7_9GAMM|nr:alpha-1,6-glucosidase domain-containing protein [Aliikangiella coralliicola]TQV89676.1 DUF3372 domain-containing protein [Aliikangiella coralliicola]
MNNLTKKITILSYVAIILTLLGLGGCGGGSVDSGKELLTCTLPLIPDPTGTSCVEPPPLDCPAPTVPNETNDQCVIGADPNAPEPSVFPGENEAILFYNRPQDASNEAGDPVYEGYRLHTWNNDACDSLAPESIAESWSNGLVHTGIDPNYGAYWILKLKEGYGDCANFIIHIGTDDAGKELGGGDWTMNLVQDDPDFVRMNWTLSGYPAVFEYPITSLGDLPLQVKDFAAHWIDATTLVWEIDPVLATEVRLHHSADASIEVDDDSNLSGTSVVLTEVELTAEQQAMYPQFASWTAYQGNWTAEEAKAVLKNQLVLAAYNADGPFQATNVQAAKALDAIYTTGDADADESALGVVYSGDNINVSVWAPTAQTVKLKIYDAAKNLTSTNDMTEDAVTGVWSYGGTASLDRQFYRFELSVYHPQNDAIETIETTDPYSVSLSTNGMYSQFVNLNDADLKPAGWDAHTVPTIVDPEDAVIYEGHIRDFSVRDESTTEANRGKYMAFTETTSAPMQHLAALASRGLTHFHMLPANDIASIGEDPANIVDIDDTVGDLCAANADAPVCGVESDSATILSVLQSYAPYSEDAQALVNSMRGLDSFNWGYDPKHFSVPDGIYASNADGVSRIIEMRAMNQALHETGLRVVLDVVYNHTSSAGLWDNSVFDKIVPGYYHRRDLVTGSVQQSTCCNDTALEHRMMDKFMKDSLLVWTEQYKFDGFRFDIMSHGSVEQMVAAREAVRAVDPDNYFYGEGWYRDDGRANQANQDNLAGTEISTFNDRIREGIRSAALFNSGGDLNEQDVVKLGMAGTLANYVLKGSSGAASTGSSFSRPSYALDPADVINYVSKHDDNTLWDKLQYNLPVGMSQEDRVRSQNIALSIPLMSQGIPFLQLGGDMLRSKSMDRNTYDAGDWFNYVDFTMTTNNWNVGLPLAQDNESNWENIVGISSNPLTATSNSDITFASNVFKEFLSIRRDSKLFRLTSEADVLARVGFHNIGSRQTQGLIVMSIDDGVGVTDLDPAFDALVVVVNGTDSEQSHTVPTAAGFSLHPTLAASVDTRMSSASFSEGTGEGTFTVPARTMAVFVKSQGAAQGEGLSAFATSGAPDVVPYGDTSVYLRGDMNGWSTDDAFEYQGDGVYAVAVALTGGTTYNFKFASEDWSTVNYGAASEGAEQVVAEGADKTLASTNFNLNITPAIDATYYFEVDASEPTAPVLNVVNEEPYVGTTVYLRGDMNSWGTTTPFTYDGGRIYTLSVPLTAGTYNFKVASEDWSTVNFGAENAGESTVELGVEELLFETNDNLNITISTDATYVFIFDMTNLVPKLRVFNQEFFAGTPVFLRGSMNGWGTDDQISYNGDGTYSIDRALTAGSYEFKVASEDWSTVNFGAENSDSAAVELGVAEGLFTTNDNLKLEITTDGTYRFMVTGPDGSAPSVTVTAL